ncbi:hypothetical protein [Streptomyces violascens]|uniref:hypothetical protein n=1 Tax=Streptomyces violascens TaxID=67381 RepID=UPI0036A30D45
MLDPKQLWLALPQALSKLNPVTLMRNPVADDDVRSRSQHHGRLDTEVGRCATGPSAGEILETTQRMPGVRDL